jgi:hypothetical protein
MDGSASQRTPGHRFVEAVGDSAADEAVSCAGKTIGASLSQPRRMLAIAAVS